VPIHEPPGGQEVGDSLRGGVRHFFDRPGALISIDRPCVISASRFWDPKRPCTTRIGVAAVGSEQWLCRALGARTRDTFRSAGRGQRRPVDAKGGDETVRCHVAAMPSASRPLLH
jgi:hypothetical protein